MTDTEIKKLQSYLKELRKQCVDEVCKQNYSKQIVETDFIGKNLFSFLWHIRKKDFTIDNVNGELQCTFSKTPVRTVVCKFKGIWCTEAVSFHDQDIPTSDTPAQIILNQIYYCALLSPTISKSDIIKIYELEKLYGISPDEIDLDMIDKIVSV